jgi:hypothetical protein
MFTQNTWTILNTGLNIMKHFAGKHYYVKFCLQNACQIRYKTPINKAKTKHMIIEVICIKTVSHVKGGGKTTRKTTPYNNKSFQRTKFKHGLQSINITYWQKVLLWGQTKLLETEFIYTCFIDGINWHQNNIKILIWIVMQWQ